MLKDNKLSTGSHRWFKNGDHPNDGNEVFTSGEFKGELLEGKVVRYFRHPDIPGSSTCKQCGLPFHIHGWIDQGENGITVCPGDFIMSIQNRLVAVSPQNGKVPAEHMRTLIF